jgi:hypothetical protein
VLLGREEVEVAGVAGDPAQGGQRQVDRRRRRPPLQEALADERDVLEAQLVPGDRLPGRGRPPVGREEFGDGSQALDHRLPAGRR